MNNGDKPAYPVECQYGEGKITGVRTGEYSGMSPGLTKREMFAMAAMQGLLAGHSEYFHGNGPVMVPVEVVKYAVIYADELLKQLDHGSNSI
jgi:hypothetical protein